MSWKMKHNVESLLLILMISSACIELNSASGDNDHVVGKWCESSVDCKDVTAYCCVITNPRAENGTCKRRGEEGHKCTVNLVRNRNNNNLYAPYLYMCACVQPRYVCHRTRGRNHFGICQFYTSAKAGG
uniref:Secreted peptide n=1 Tax=Rhipicephalus pulchellus TaxID=72859 RepID=L7LYL9_RHIPC